MVEQERERAQTEQQELTQTQPHQTPQAHLERTARITAETVVVVEQVVVVLTAEHQVMVDRVTTVVLAVSQDQTTRPVEQKTTVQGSLREAQDQHIIPQALR